MNANNKLVRISNWANALSWIVLAIYFLYFASAIVLEVQQDTFALRTNLFSIFTLAFPLVSGAVFFIILQAIAAGAAVLLEIEKRIG